MTPIDWADANTKTGSFGHESTCRYMILWIVAGRQASRAYHGGSHVILILDINCHDSASCNSWFSFCVKGAHMPFWTQSTAEAFERAMNWVRITILSCNPDSQVDGDVSIPIMRIVQYCTSGTLWGLQNGYWLTSIFRLCIANIEMPGFLPAIPTVGFLKPFLVDVVGYLTWLTVDAGEGCPPYFRSCFFCPSPAKCYL